MSVHLIIGGTSLDHLVKVCLLGFFTARLVINDYYGGATLRLRKYLISPQTFTPHFRIHHWILLTAFIVVVFA